LKEAKTHPTISSFEKNLERINIKLFEYDKRFEIYGNDFVFYDYKEPLNFDQNLNDFFDLIIVDPPFLADECQIKTGMTIKKVGKSNHKLIVCTGN
jgi:EEF1A lysine methyltransferase 1